MPVVLDKLFGKERTPFLVLSEEATAPVDVAPVRSEDDEAEPSVSEVATLQVAPADPSEPSVAPPAAASVGSAATESAPTTKTPPTTKTAATSTTAPTEAATTSEERVLTTAELLAAERAQAAAPPRQISTVTFAAELLNPSSALPRARRRPGAALNPFRQMAKGVRSSVSAGRGNAAAG